MSDFLTLDSGPVQARIDKPSGRLEVAGPDRRGTAQSTVITIDPGSAKAAGREIAIGGVVSSTAGAGSLDLVQTFGAATVKTRLSFPFPGVMRYEVLDWGGAKPAATSVSVRSEAGEHFYGFGEKFNALDQSEKVVDMLVFDNPGNKGDRSYKVAPWFISTRGYGFHLDSTARSTFDMRSAATGRYTVSNHVGTLAFQIVYGPALTDVLTRYTGYSGRPPLPPPWAFGPWISSDIWRDGGEVRYAVETFRRRGIPVSGFVFDSPWETAYNDFKFNLGSPTDSQFGRPGTFEGKAHAGFATVAEMMTFFSRNGLKVICWMTPFVNVSSTSEGVRGQNLDRAKPDRVEDRFFVRDRNTNKPLVVPWWKGLGSPIDFTQADARKWLVERLRDLVAACRVPTRSGQESAIGGFKTDDGEFGNGDNTYIPDNALYDSGLSGREFVNGYCREYHRTVYGVLGQQGLLFARSGFSGTQAFPGCWAGDNEPNFGDQNGLPSVIVAGLSAAMSGYAVWGHDVGGYQNHNFSTISPADLFIRWTQFGCFSPIMQMHRQVADHDLRQYPWGYAEAGETLERNRALDNYRFYADLHTRLFPYLYTFAKQAAETGLPILRPLVLIHPDDARTFSVRHTYYFGSDMLVAPIIQAQVSERNVYLPAGEWIDFWTNRRHAGGQLVTWRNPAVPVEPASKIPVFVRRGAIVPLLANDGVQTLCDADYVDNPAIRTWTGNLELRIYPASDSQFSVYDGTHVRCRENGAGVEVTVTSPMPRAVLMQILAAKPTSVKRDGVVVPEIDALGSFDQADTAWRFDAALGLVAVKFPQPGGTTRIVV